MIYVLMCKSNTRRTQILVNFMSRKCIENVCQTSAIIFRASVCLLIFVSASVNIAVELWDTPPPPPPSPAQPPPAQPPAPTPPPPPKKYICI